MGIDVRQKGRADLKGYFLKNAIPSETNFSDLIDSLLFSFPAFYFVLILWG